MRARPNPAARYMAVDRGRLAWGYRALPVPRCLGSRHALWRGRTRTPMPPTPSSRRTLAWRYARALESPRPRALYPPSASPFPDGLGGSRIANLTDEPLRPQWGQGHHHAYRASHGGMYSRIALVCTAGTQLAIARMGEPTSRVIAASWHCACPFPRTPPVREWARTIPLGVYSSSTPRHAKPRSSPLGAGIRGRREAAWREATLPRAQGHPGLSRVRA